MKNHGSVFVALTIYCYCVCLIDFSQVLVFFDVLFSDSCFCCFVKSFGSLESIKFLAVHSL